MKKTFYALILLALLLAPCIYAEDVVNSPPPPAQSVSFDSLASFKTDLAETKTQLSAALEQQYAKLLLLLLVWTIGWTAFLKLLGRIWSYILAKRFERSTESYQERVLSNLKAINARLDATDALVVKLSRKVDDIPLPTLDLTPKSEKRSFLGRFWPWRKKE
jgi:phytoene dehydrogenase-like protein